MTGSSRNDGRRSLRREIVYAANGGRWPSGRRKSSGRCATAWGLPKRKPWPRGQPTFGETFGDRRALDSLNHDRHPEGCSESHDRLDDGRLDAACQHLGHKRPIDLELVDRKRSKVPQRREASSEVVERHADPSGAKDSQPLNARLATVKNDAFCDLEI